MKVMHVLLAALVSASVAHAEPKHSAARVIVPFPAGSAADVAARTVFDSVSKYLNTPFVIEDRAGSSGEIGVSAFLQAPPDGRTFLFSPDGPMATMPATYIAAGKHGLYDPTTLTPISQVAESYFVLVVAREVTANDTAALIAYGSAHPKTLTFYSANPSGTLGIALLNERGAEIVADPDSAGGEPHGHQGLLARIDQGMFSTTSTALPFLKDGSEKALGSMGPTRSPFLPDVKTLDEQGFPEFRTLKTWNAVFAPPGTPEAIVRTLNEGIAAALKDPQVLQKFAAMDISARPSSPKALGRLVKEQLRTLTQVIRETGVQLK